MACITLHVHMAHCGSILHVLHGTRAHGSLRQRTACTTRYTRTWLTAAAYCMYYPVHVHMAHFGSVLHILHGTCAHGSLRQCTACTTWCSVLHILHSRATRYMHTVAHCDSVLHVLHTRDTRYTHTWLTVTAYCMYYTPGTPGTRTNGSLRL